MTAGARTIEIEPGSEIDRLIEDAGMWPIILVRKGVRYRLAIDEAEDPWAGYNPEKVREALDKYAGSITEAEADEWIADIYRAREQGSRGTIVP